MDKYISVRTNGGLGNQLFQYAAAYALSRAWSYRLVIDLPPSKHEQFLGHPRKYALDEFTISGRPAPFTPFTRLLASRNNSFSWFLQPLRKLMSVGLLDEMPGKPLDPALLHTPPGYQHISFWGNWPSYQWAKQCEEELRNELRFKKEPAGENAKILERIRGCECAVSLHVRRGDYLEFTGPQVLAIGYYRNAFSVLCERIHASSVKLPPNSDSVSAVSQSSGPSAISFFVFSDDISWCREALPPVLAGAQFSAFGLQTSLFFVDNNDESRPHEDLRLMSSCSHHIVANSSFSWWGAWLNPDKGKIVVRPAMGNEHVDSYPPSWRPARAY